MVPVACKPVKAAKVPGGLNCTVCCAFSLWCCVTCFLPAASAIRCGWCLQGLLAVHDVLRAAELGVDAIVVSNHGGWAVGLQLLTTVGGRLVYNC